MPLTTRYGFADSPTPGDPTTAWTTVASGGTIGTSTVVVASAASFPSSVEFDIVVGLLGTDDTLSNTEKAHVLSVSGSTFTIQGTWAATHAGGESIYHDLTALGLKHNPGAATDSGDFQYLDATGRMARLAAPANGNYLITWTGAVPGYTAGVTGAGATNQVAVWSSASALSGSAGLTFTASTLALTGLETITTTMVDPDADYVRVITGKRANGTSEASLWLKSHAFFSRSDTTTDVSGFDIVPNGAPTPYRGDMTWYFNDVTTSPADYSGFSQTVTSGGLVYFGMVSVGTAPVTPSKISFTTQRGNYGAGTEVANIDDVNQFFNITKGGSILTETSITSTTGYLKVAGAFYIDNNGSDAFISLGSTEVASASPNNGFWTMYKSDGGSFYRDVRTGQTHVWRINANDIMTLSSTVLALSTGITLPSGGDIVISTTTGTKIGTGTTQLLGFYNATPIAQGASVADATGGAIIDAEARTAINALISRIEATGLIATV